MAYAHLGLSEEVFMHLDVLKEAVRGEWAVQDRFGVVLVYTNQYMKMGQWDKVVECGREYVDWAKAIPPNDATLFIEPLCLTGKAEHAEKGKVGEWVRWWSICYTLADRVAKSLHKAGRDTSAAFSELDWALEQHEAHVRALELRAAENLHDEQLQDEAREQKKHFSGNFIKVGEAAYEVGRYEDVLRYYRRQEELAGSLYERGPLYLAAALTALGRVDEAKERLRHIYGAVVTRGQCRAYFARCREFDCIRQDADIVSLIQEWERSEVAGAPLTSGSWQ